MKLVIIVTILTYFCSSFAAQVETKCSDEFSTSPVNANTPPTSSSTLLDTSVPDRQAQASVDRAPCKMKNTARLRNNGPQLMSPRFVVDPREFRRNLLPEGKNAF